MPSLMNSADRVDHLVSAVVHLIETDGVEAVTIRRIAGVMRLSPSTLTSHLTDKRRMIDLVIKGVETRLTRSIRARSLRYAVCALIPDDEDLPLVRAWLALTELARADDELSEVVASGDDELRDLVGRLARVRAADDPTLDALRAVVIGLWVARCAGADPMPTDRAIGVLRHACAALGIDAEPDAA
jgi:AcrR family transcriptional regulator